MNPTKRNLLITGGAGNVATFLRQHWGERHTLRLADIRPVEDLSSHEEAVEFDISDLEAFTKACEGIDTVVHLAADPSPRADFYESLLQRNVIGAYNGFEAARRAGCRRLVFASSINAVSGYDRSRTPVDWDAPVYPSNVYGATKCWGEALARVYSHTHGLSCLCVRLTRPRFRQDDFDPAADFHGVSARDTAQVFLRCVEAPDDVKFGIVHGVSKHDGYWFQVSASDERIGFEPQDGTAFPKTGDT